MYKLLSSSLQNLLEFIWYTNFNCFKMLKLAIKHRNKMLMTVKCVSAWAFNLGQARRFFEWKILSSEYRFLNQTLIEIKVAHSREYRRNFWQCAVSMPHFFFIFLCFC